jgi:transketolase
LTTPGNFAVVMGRSKIATILDENGRPFFAGEYQYSYGRMETVRSGKKVALVAAGNMLVNGLAAWEKLAGEGHRVALISVSDWSDIHADDLKILGSFEHVVVLEDHNVKTGLGTTIGSALLEAGHTPGLVKLGVGRYAASGKPDDLYRMAGLDGDSVAATIRNLL